MSQNVDPKTMTVLITGATAGFGAATARRFAAAGARVIGTGRRGERLAALKKELGERCHTATYDVTDNAARRRRCCRSSAAHSRRSTWWWRTPAARSGSSPRIRPISTTGTR